MEGAGAGRIIRSWYLSFFLLLFLCEDIRIWVGCFLYCIMGMGGLYFFVLAFCYYCTCVFICWIK